ncbi:MAG: hypothetical protein ACYC28_06010 [Longimicrobiales bacterium]
MSSGSTMTYGPQQSFVPVSIDLHSLVRRSVASLYSHLVTRPTGRALRLGIESQIVELGDRCLSVLDFRQVVILDYSCADEAVAKLVLRYLNEDRPADAYFLARGVSDHHLDPIEAVLARYHLALVAEVDEVGFTLLGEVESLERYAWLALQEAGVASVNDIAKRLDADVHATSSALASLARRRTVIEKAGTPLYCALPALLQASA